jgi:hypothetical protein
VLYFLAVETPTTGSRVPVPPKRVHFKGARIVARIFLCHASEDKAQVREVYHRLRAIDGFEPWLDEEDLLSGQEWAREIPRALQTSDFILIFLSRNSVAKRGYVQREMKLALDALQELPEGTIHTIPVRIDECEVPESFRRYHWANLFEPTGFDRVVRAIRAELARGRGTTTPLIQHPPPSTSPTEAPTTAATALEPARDWVVKFTVPGEVGSARIVVSQLIKSFGETVNVLTLYYPEQEPTQLLRVEGHSLEVEAIDFDADGRPEIAVLWHCGAHTQGFRLFRLKTSGEPALIPGTDLGSDWPLISWNSLDDKGCREIITRDRDWKGVPTRGYREKRFGWNGDSYALLSEQFVCSEPEDA